MCVVQPRGNMRNSHPDHLPDETSIMVDGCTAPATRRAPILDGEIPAEPHHGSRLGRDLKLIVCLKWNSLARAIRQGRLPLRGFAWRVERSTLSADTVGLDMMISLVAAAIEG